SGAQTVPPAGIVPQAKAGPPLPVAPFGKHRISRLIAGANPIYGYSHFNYLYSAHMGEYHTTARVIAFLRELERAGLNTWQASWSERLETDWLKYKDEGGKLQLLILSRPTFNDQPEMLVRVMKLKPLGIAQHGGSTNRYWDAGHFERSLDYLKRIRDTGAMVGLSCHNPLAVEHAEDKGWDVDYYMTALYYMIRPKKEFERILGQVPLGEIYLPQDPPRMMETIRRVKKPCLVYKVLAAGRSVNSPAEVKERIGVALNGIKPNDALLIGLYQRFNDQIGQTAQFVREILTS
ncbi:MAG: hypothetical protein NTY38_31160, partial [Acidobacteria bacterium]|nr:hypothetical protein [Acidobacteriota bacterium]